MPRPKPRPPAPDGDYRPRPGPRYASIQAAAELYTVDPKTVRSWISEGLINGYRMGKRNIRVDLNEIDAWVVRKVPTGRRPTATRIAG